MIIMNRQAGLAAVIIWYLVALSVRRTSTLAAAFVQRHHHHQSSHYEGTTRIQPKVPTSSLLWMEEPNGSSAPSAVVDQDSLPPMPEVSPKGVYQIQSEEQY